MESCSTNRHTHTHALKSFVNSLVVARVRAYVTNVRRRHHRVAAAHPLPLPLPLLLPLLPLPVLSSPLREQRVAIIVASQAVISPCPCRICRRCFSPTVSWLAVCSMKLVTSIFVVDVVVVIGRIDCAGARPNHLLLPSSSPCCSTPLCGLPACPPAVVPAPCANAFRLW